MLRGARQGRMRAAAHRDRAGQRSRAGARRAARREPRDRRERRGRSASSACSTPRCARRFGVTHGYVRSARQRRRRHQWLSRHLAARSRSLGVGGSVRMRWPASARRWSPTSAPRSPSTPSTASGRHRGGAIAPGPGHHGREPAHRARTASAGAPAARAAAGARALFATDTASALAAGSVFAAAAFIDRACAEARATLGARPLLLLTGGAAPALAALFRESVPACSRPRAARAGGVRQGLTPRRGRRGPFATLAPRVRAPYSCSC